MRGRISADKLDLLKEAFPGERDVEAFQIILDAERKINLLQGDQKGIVAYMLHTSSVE